MEAVFITTRRYTDWMASKRIPNVPDWIDMETATTQFLHTRHAGRTDCWWRSTRNPERNTFNGVCYTHFVTFHCCFLTFYVHLSCCRQRDRLEDLIRHLTPERSKIGDCMVFCIEHADAADEICECIEESMSNTQTLISKKIARLYLVSDILHNCTVKVSNASFYRTS